MGGGRKEALRFDFDGSVKVEFHGANVTSDTGLPAFRELDEALGLTGMMADFLVDAHTGLNPRHTLLAQLGQPGSSRPAGYEEKNLLNNCAGIHRTGEVSASAPRKKKQPRPVKRVVAALVLPQPARRGLY